MAVNIGIFQNDHFLLNNYIEFFRDFNDLNICFAVQTMEEFQLYSARKVKTKPSVILLDIQVGTDQDPDLIRTIHYRFPLSKILVIGSEEDDSVVIKSFRNGAVSYINRNARMAGIYEALLHVSRDGAFIPSDQCSRIIDILNSGIPEEISRQLTPRELELVLFLRNGLTYKELANAMYISIYTINHHLKKIYTKLNVSSKAQLISKVRSSQWK